MPVTQQDVVRAAVAAINDNGVAGLTLRGVAARLGVTAPTLYWHVRSKRHLLDLVAEQVLAEDVPGALEMPAAGQPVVDWLAQRARAQRRVLLAHRDSAQIVAGNRPTPDALPRIERTLGALVDAGLRPGEALRVLTALGSFILGDVLETQSEAQRPLEEEPEGRPDEHYPTAAAAICDLGDEDARFEEGLALFLGGLSLRLFNRGTPSQLGT